MNFFTHNKNGVRQNVQFSIRGQHQKRELQKIALSILDI